MPWSTPYTWPSGVGMMCPPLRSALLTTASNTAIRRSAGYVAADERRRGRPSGSPSIHSCTMPGAERAVAQHRRRHDPPAGRLGHQVRRDLAAGEGAVGEVPQRPLPRHRLVDALAATVRRRGSCRPASRCVASSSRPSRSISPSRSRRGPRRRPRGAQVRPGLGGLLAHAATPPVSGGSRSAAGRRARPGPAAGSTAGRRAGRRRRPGGRGR